MSSCLEIQKLWVTSRVDAARTSSQRRDLRGHLKHSTPRDPKARASIKYPQSPCADPSSMLRLWPSRTPRAHHSGHWGPQRMQESRTVPGRWAVLWLRCGSLGDSLCDGGRRGASKCKGKGEVWREAASGVDEGSQRAWAARRLRVEEEARRGSCKRHRRLWNLFSRRDASVMPTSYLFLQWYLYICSLFSVPEIPRPEFKKPI